MPTPRRTTEERRIELADAALEIIATRGISKLTTKNVADAVGLTTGAIFRHFESLDALLAAVADRVVELLDRSYPPATLEPLERLERFVEARSATIGDRVGILRLMMSEQFAMALPEPAARRLRAAIDATRAFLVTTIAEAQAGHQLRADIAPEPLAVIIMGTIQMLGLSVTHVPRAGRAAHRHAVRAALVLLLAPPITRARRT